MWSEIEHKYLPWRDYDHNEFMNRGTIWHNQQHLFKGPFSYIDYDLAQLGAFEFYGKSKTDYTKAWNDYAAFCHMGGSSNYLNLLSAGNLTNPFTSGAVAKICAPIIDELYASFQ